VTLSGTYLCLPCWIFYGIGVEMGELFRKRGGDEKQYGDLTPLPNFSKEKPLFNPEAEHILADELRGFILGKRSTGRYMDIEYLPHLAYLSAFLKQSAEKGSGLRPDFEKTPFEKNSPLSSKPSGSRHYVMSDAADIAVC